MFVERDEKTVPLLALDFHNYIEDCTKCFQPHHVKCIYVTSEDCTSYRTLNYYTAIIL